MTIRTVKRLSFKLGEGTADRWVELVKAGEEARAKAGGGYGAFTASMAFRFLLRRWSELEQADRDRSLTASSGSDQVDAAGPAESDRSPPAGQTSSSKKKKAGRAVRPGAAARGPTRRRQLVRGGSR